MGLDVASGVVDGMVRKEAHTLHLGMCKLPVDCRCNKLPEACSNPLLDPVAETKHVLRHWPEAQQLLECSSCLPLCTFVLEEVSKIEDCGERALVVEGKDAEKTVSNQDVQYMNCPLTVSSDSPGTGRSPPP